MRVKYNEDILWQVSLQSPSRNGSGCKWVPNGAKVQVGMDCRGAEKSTDKKRSRMSPWRLVKKILEQVFGVGLGPALFLGELCPAVPHARELQPLQGAWCPLAVQEQGHCQSPADSAALGNSAALPEYHPQATLEKKGSITVSVVQKEKQRGHRNSIKIQSRSTRLSDSPTLFMGTPHPPHTAHVFSTENQDLTLQHLRDILLRSSLFVISTNWERLRAF